MGVRGIVSRTAATLTRSRWVRTDTTLTARTGGSVWLGSDGWDLITPGSARMIDVVNRAERLVVGAVVTLPWRTWRDRDGDLTERRVPLWVRDPHLLSGAPGPGAPILHFQRRKTAHRFWHDVLSTAWLDEVAWVTAAVDSAGQPLAGTLLQLDSTMVHEQPDRSVVIDPEHHAPITTDRDGGYEVGGTRWRVWRHDGPGVVRRHAESLGLAVTVRNYINGTLHSGVPLGYLKYSGPEMSQAEADTLKRKWLEGNGGDRRSIAVLNAVTEFNPIAISPIDAQAKDMAQVSLLAVAHACNMSAWMLDAEVATSTYANIQDRRQDHVDHTLAQFAQPQEQVLSSLLPFGTELQIDYRGYLLTDSAARCAYYAAGIAAGWLTADEARTLERLPRRLTQEA